MPSRPKVQARLMRAAAHDRILAKKTGVPQKVARDFTAADRKVARKRKLTLPERAS